MLNYVTNRFEEFSSEMKQTANMPSIIEITQSPIISNSNLTSINKVVNDSLAQTIASRQSVDIQKFEKKISKNF
jgi:ribosomal protein L18E